MLFPSLLILLLLTVQPVCVLYTRAVAEGAAAATARLMVTATGDDEAYRAFALRRLAAVPDLAIFHAGGPYAWDIEFTRAHEGAGRVGVVIEGAVRPLPVLGVFAAAAGRANAQGDVVVSVEVSYAGRPSWVEGEAAPDATEGT